MAALCDLCAKGTAFGRNIRHRHSGRWQRKAPRTSRVFRPNLHRQTIYIGGDPVRVRLCTRCLRTLTRSAV